MTVWQVRFMSMSVVSAVQTQGRSGLTWIQWVSTYRLEFSQDCINFHSVLNVHGSNQVGSWKFCYCLSLLQFKYRPLLVDGDSLFIA